MTSQPLLPQARRWAPVLLALILAAMPLRSNDWPQWRGPGGLGVAPEGAVLPTEWQPETAHYQWTVPVPGKGNSSPIVSGDRVFVTTAYEGQRSAWLDRGVVVLAVALAAGLLLWLLTRWRGGRPLPRAATAISVLFLLLAIAIALQPELFYKAGSPGRTWRATGALALVGLVATCGWLKPGSRTRLLGVVALVAAAGFVAWLVPASKVGPAPWSKRIVIVLPALLGAALYLWGALRGGGRARTSGGYTPWTALPLLLLSLAVFVPPNYWNGLLRVVVCYDLESGDKLWETAVFAAPPEQKYRAATYANPTPATNGELVFAYFGAGIAAVDFDGRVRWVERFPDYSRYSRYGAATGPVLAGDAVIVVQESEAYQGGPPGWILALDQSTGETLWRTTPERARDSYGTPLVVERSTGTQLLTASWGFLAAYDTATGEQLWSLDYPMMQMVASMARAGDLVAVSGGAHGDKKLMVVRLADDDGPPQVLWESVRSVARVPSPVFYRGLLFTLTDGGILTCYEAETGAEQWRKRLDGDHFASLLAGDGKVYAVNIDGVTTVVAAERDHRRLAVNELGEPVYATPAVAGSSLLLRGVGHLYRIAAEG